MKKFYTVLTSFLLTGCASMTTGSNQSISVNTEPEKSASCELQNDKGSWFIPITPGSVMIHRSYGDLAVVCKKEEKSGSTNVKSSAKGMTYGNILVGGLIGAAVDVGTGAGYDYPTMIHVPLTK
jgi:hypothetical protein